MFSLTWLTIVPFILTTGGSLRHDKHHLPRWRPANFEARNSTPFTTGLNTERLPCPEDSIQTATVTVTITAGQPFETTSSSSRKTRTITETATVYETLATTTSSSVPSTEITSAIPPISSASSLGGTSAIAAQSFSSFTNSTLQTSTSLSASQSQEPSATATSSILTEATPSITTITSNIPPPSQPTATLGAKCPESSYQPKDYADGFPSYFGFNMVNTQPFNVSEPSQKATVRTPEQWHQGMKDLKARFPNMTAIRMYSTTDGPATHLLNAVPGANAEKLKILAGLWANQADRFSVELSALETVIEQYGCDDIFAVAVGNEDLHYLVEAMGENSTAYPVLVADLVSRINQTRRVLRDKGCCNVPVTHVDIVGELLRPETKPILQAVDHAIVANIFPYWSQVAEDQAVDNMNQTANKMNEYAEQLKRAVWLGETGWATSDAGHHNNKVNADALPANAESYFKKVGCQILQGHGTAFWYVDWDEDVRHSSDRRPEFGVLDFRGQPKFDLTCGEQGQSVLSSIGNGPSWLGGSGW